MAEVASALPNLATVVFAVSSMLHVGFSYTLADIVRPLGNFTRVVMALIANFVLVPLLAYFVVRLLALDAPLAVGLSLVGAAAGAPFLIRLTTAAASDVALSATLLVLLLPATVIFMPFAVPLMVPGVSVSALSIALPLVLTMLVPLALALVVRARSLKLALRLQPIMGTTSGYALVALVALTTLANLPGILDVTMRAILAALLVICGAFVIGYVLGGRSLEAREVLGLGTGQRNIGAATVVAAQGFEDPDVLIMVVVSALLGLAVLFPIASKLRERGAAQIGAGAKQGQPV